MESSAQVTQLTFPDVLEDPKGGGASSGGTAAPETILGFTVSFNAVQVSCSLTKQIVEFVAAHFVVRFLFVENSRKLVLSSKNRANTPFEARQPSALHKVQPCN